MWTNEGGITLRRPFGASFFGFQKYRLEHLKAKKTAVIPFRKQLDVDNKIKGETL